MSLQYLICLRIFQKSVLLYFHSFIHSFHWHVQNATNPCRSQQFLPFLSVIYFSCHPSPPTILPSSLTSSCHLFLGLPLSLLLFPNSCIILFVIFYLLLLLLYSYTVCLVQHFLNCGCAFEIRVVIKHKSSDMNLLVQVRANVGPNRILL